MSKADLKIFTISVTAYQQNCRMLINTATNKAAVIDPGEHAQYLVQFAKEQGAEISEILLTHAHLDHVGGAGELSKLTGITVIGPEFGDAELLRNIKAQSALLGLPPCEEFSPHYVKDGEEFNILGDETLKMRVIATPGHTPGSVCYLCDKMLFSGDTLFKMSAGRCDLPGGDEEKLLQSLQRLSKLDDDVTVLSGHGPITTMGFEKKNNPFMQAIPQD